MNRVTAKPNALEMLFLRGTSLLAQDISQKSQSACNGFTEMLV